MFIVIVDSQRKSLKIYSQAGDIIEQLTEQINQMLSSLWAQGVGFDS